jgi:hypothetical protein
MHCIGTFLPRLALPNGLFPHLQLITKVDPASGISCLLNMRKTMNSVEQYNFNEIL